MQNPPYLYREVGADQPGNLQLLTSIEVLDQVDHRLDQIEALQRLFTMDLPFELPQPVTETEDPPSLSGIFLTAIANQLLEKDFTPAPLVRADIPRLKEMTFSDGQISEPFCQSIYASMQQLAPDCDFFVQFCLDNWEQIFQNAAVADDDAPIFNTYLLMASD